MYYICKFSGTWSLYDAEKFSSKLLDPTEVQLLKTMFPGLLGDNSKILTAVQIAAISPTKLLQLQDGIPDANNKKNGEQSARSPVHHAPENSK